MNTNLTLPAHGGGESPFDEIRQIRDNGTEFWSARDLCKAVEYETWRNFANAIDRAKIAADNGGTPAHDHFVGADKMIDLGKGGRRSVEDYELSRYACYLILMNGDPRKPKIAAAQQYFAIRTRESEVREAETRDQLLARAVIEAQAVMAELTPKAEKFDRFLTSEGDMSVSEAAGVIHRAGVLIGEIRLFQAMHDDPLGWLYKTPKGKWRARQWAKDRGLVAEKPQGEWLDPETGRSIVRTPQVRVRPKGVDVLLETLRGAA